MCPNPIIFGFYECTALLYANSFDIFSILEIKNTAKSFGFTVTMLHITAAFI